MLIRQGCITFLVLACCMLGARRAAGYPADYLSHEAVQPDTLLEAHGAFEQAPSPPLSRAARLADALWGRASLSLQPRSYYLERQRDGRDDSQAWAAGGSLEYRSGLHRERLSLGATAYTSQKLQGPQDKDGTLLLRSGQQSFSVLGEAYLDARLTERIEARLYRQSFHLPYVNRQDNRMAPNTFEAYSIFAPDPDARLRWIAGHITKIKPRNADGFESMAQAAGARNADDGLSMLGGRYSLTRHDDIGAIHYRAWNVMDLFYLEANTAWQLGEELALRLSGQYTRQKSSGDELTGTFDTDVHGLQLGMSYRGTILSVAHTRTDRDSGIRSPWGGYPGYASVIIQDFNRAGEDAWLFGVSWNAAILGLDGLTLFANYVSGDTPESGSAASPDQQEFDLTADYHFGKGATDGLWLRARAALLQQSGDGAVDQQDFRVILNYSLPLH